MCINLVKIEPDLLVPCRACWQCRADRVNELTGRALAEARYARAVSVITLTYGDEVGSAVLLLGDVQRLWKRLRKRYSFLYLVCGEFGHLKGRAHWHALVFWQSDPPPLPEARIRVEWPFWKHGLSFFDDFSAASVRYVVKYMLKDQNREHVTHRVAWSTRPTLGARYFNDWADQLTVQRIIPPAPVYRFAEDRDRNGKLREHWLKGRSLEKFIDSLAIKWRLAYGEPWPGYSHEWVTKAYSEKIMRDAAELYYVKKGLKVGTLSPHLDPWGEA